MFLVKMKVCKMSDWIDDLFDKIDEQEDMILDRLRDVLLRKLDACRFEYIVHDEYVERILSSDLNRAEYVEMSHTFDQNVLDVRYQYAPSQKEISKWIRAFCEL